MRNLSLRVMSPNFKRTLDNMVSKEEEDGRQNQAPAYIEVTSLEITLVIF